MAHHLAQLNIGRLAHPLDAAESQGFVDELEPVNALADTAPGFVWRLQDEEGDATSIHLFDDDRVIVNLSVWESIEAWRDFVFSGRHRDVMRQRRTWFERMEEAYVVMWWVPVGHTPSPRRRSNGSTCSDASARRRRPSRCGSRTIRSAGTAADRSRHVR